MIDFGATGNFITKKYTKIKKYSTQDKKQFYKLINLNNISLRNDSG